MSATRLAGLPKTSSVTTLLPVVLWTFFFVFVYEQVDLQFCKLTENTADPVLPILRGCYWGLLIILFIRSFRQLPDVGLRTSLTIILFTCVVSFSQDIGLHGITQAQNWLGNKVQPGTATFWWLVVCYALILSIPFVPGIELGLLLMMMFGEPGIIAAYAATVLGLLVPYLVGRTLPRVIPGRNLRQFAARSTLLNSKGTTQTILNKLTNTRLAEKILRYRPVCLAIAFNLPCNSLIGGGGSIAIFTGTHQLVSFRSYVLVISLATLPVPLMAYAGLIQIESILAGQELTDVTPLCPEN